MADLTLYLPSSGAAAHDCAYSAIWEGTSGAAHIGATTTKGTTAIAARYPYRGSTQDYALGGQWVSPAQAARSWTTSDTFDWAMIVRDENSFTCTTVLSIRVFNAAGDTVVGTLFEGEPGGTAWPASYASRYCTGVAVQNAVDCPEGGHIVVEIGFKSSQAAGFDCRILDGEGAAGASPVSLNESDTNSDHYPFVAFTYGAAVTDTELIPGNCAHASASSTPTLNELRTLEMQSCAVALTCDGNPIVENLSLEVQGAAIAHASSVPTLNELRTLAVASNALAHASTTPTLNELRTLTVQSAAITHAASAPTLVEHKTLAVSSCDVVLATETIGLGVAGTLVVADCAVASAASAPTLIELRTLAVANAALGHAASTPAIVEHKTLAVGNAALALASEVVALAQQHRLTVTDATLALSTVNAILSTPEYRVLVMSDAAFALEAHLIYMLELTESLLHAEDADPRRYVQGVDPRDYTQASDDRPYVQRADPRQYVHAIDPRPRIVEVAPRLRP